MLTNNKLHICKKNISKEMLSKYKHIPIEDLQYGQYRTKVDLQYALGNLKDNLFYLLVDLSIDDIIVLSLSGTYIEEVTTSMLTGYLNQRLLEKTLMHDKNKVHLL